MSKCPRCNSRELNPDPVDNAISRHDNATIVCDPCGTDEAMLDYYGHGVGAVWPGYPGPVDRAITFASTPAHLR